MGLLPDTWNCALHMHRECREHFPHHRLQRKLLVSDPGMHHGTCVTHVPWCMSESLTRSDGENVSGIPSACATRDFTYLAIGPWSSRARVARPRTQMQNLYFTKRILQCRLQYFGRFCPGTNISHICCWYAAGMMECEFHNVIHASFCSTFRKEALCLYIYEVRKCACFLFACDR